ncbi:hypothetical protein WR25_08362 [Diploscapter pachys]|uniref:Uncharacterized protein n=1 Tax=Diploscapter pachys TaxID=2018661 RepID=A0A2A2M251_9BILA|nr:hypothetical protein WR25_08362 [Diploscapter pachys]
MIDPAKCMIARTLWSRIAARTAISSATFASTRVARGSTAQAKPPAPPVTITLPSNLISPLNIDTSNATLAQQIFRKGTYDRPDVVAYEREREVRLDVARLVPAIVARAIEGKAMERLLADQLRHGVGQLDLAPRTLFLALQDAHHFRLQDVAPGDHQRRDLGQPPVDLARRDDAIFVRLAVGHLQRTDDVAADLFISCNHLRDEARRADHQFVRQQHRKRFVTNDFARAPDGVAEAQRLLLADIDRAARLHARAVDDFEALAPRAHRVFQFVGDVEMVFERVLAPARNEDDLLDPRLERLVHRILDQRLVDDRQHFLRHRLGRRQEPGAEACDRENRLPYALDRHSTPYL